MAACISGSPISAFWIWPYRVQSSAVESRPMVLVAGPPTMVASTVMFSAPCLRASSVAFLSCFCTSSHWTPGFGWIATYETIVMVVPPSAVWLFATPQANTRMPLRARAKMPCAATGCSVRSLRDGPGEAPSCLGSHFVIFTLNAILVVLPLCFVYPPAFRALLDVFVIRIPIGTHQFLLLYEFIC